MIQHARIGLRFEDKTDAISGKSTWADVPAGVYSPVKVNALVRGLTSKHATASLRWLYEYGYRPLGSHPAAL